MTLDFVGIVRHRSVLLCLPVFCWFLTLELCVWGKLKDKYYLYLVMLIQVAKILLSAFHSAFRKAKSDFLLIPSTGMCRTDYPCWPCTNPSDVALSYHHWSCSWLSASSRSLDIQFHTERKNRTKINDNLSCFRMAVAFRYAQKNFSCLNCSSCFLWCLIMIWVLCLKILSQVPLWHGVIFCVLILLFKASRSNMSKETLLWCGIQLTQNSVIDHDKTIVRG